ncbi:hypothetical protein N665_0008s0272 [Sinapis alba]|nr:hypothetical protein N665_0008s0272 [Sinapis alba]
MVLKGCRPNLTTFNVRIQFLVNRGRAWDAKLPMMEPDSVIYNMVIKGLGTLENGLWNHMVLKGCRPNLTTFNVRIQFLVNRGRAWDAKLPMMEPDSVIYNMVIKGIFVAGFPEMAERYLCKAGKFDLGYTMCKDCMRKKWYPNLDTAGMLLEGLVKKGQLDQAKLIVGLVQKRVSPYSSKHLLSLESIL